MRTISLIFAALMLTVFAHAQQPAQTSDRMGLSLDKLLAPADSDKDAAKQLDVKVFRLLPRETYDGAIDIRGGGAYYSFTAKVGTVITTVNPPNPVINSPSATSGFERTADQKYNTTALSNQGFSLEDARDRPGLPRLIDPHYYGFGSDIELQRGKFSVGFAGLDYGFLYDLETASLGSVSLETPEAAFLASYKPPVKHSEIRDEQNRLFQPPQTFNGNGFVYRREFPAIVGHTYLLRSLNFRRSDVLVALQVYRQDADGSLIVFWKKLKTFEKPEVEK